MLYVLELGQHGLFISWGIDLPQCEQKWYHHCILAAHVALFMEFWSFMVALSCSFSEKQLGS